MCRIDISVISRSCKLAVDVQPDVHWQMYCILPLHNAYRLVHAFAVAVDHNVKPLRKHSHIYTRLPYPKPELSTHKCLHEVPPAKVLISNDGYLSVVAVWPGGIYNGIVKIGIGHLCKIVPPYHSVLKVVQSCWL